MTAIAPDLGDRVLDTDTAVVWTQQARETYQAMIWHVDQLGRAYGEEHKWTREAATSLAHVSSSIVGWGNVRVTRDDTLSLFCQARGGFVFGIIFHGIARRCLVAGCTKYANDQGGLYHYGNRDQEQVQLHRHRWLYPLDAPTPGSWSFHS